MDNFDILYEQVQKLLVELKDSFHLIKEEKRVINTRYDDLKYSFDKETKAHQQCQNKLEEIFKDNEKMKSQINVLEEDRAQFAKVSHIIALEKDNAKLKAELEAHKQRIATLSAVPVAFAPTPSQVVEEAAAEDQSFYEKKIKGVIYYVGVETSTIYMKENEEVGDTVGTIEKDPVTGKNKVVWFKQ